MANDPRHPSSPTYATSQPHQSATAPHPRLASLADAGLRASMLSKPLKGLVPSEFELPPLTGAAAMADERRLRQEEQYQASRLTSLNPAVNAMSALRGGHSISPAMSRASDGAIVEPQIQRRIPSLTTSHAIVSEPMHIDQALMVSPHSQISESGARHYLNNGSNRAYEQQSPKASEDKDGRREDRSNKALTYPPPRPEDLEPVASARGMSLPSDNMSPGNTKSSFKKHKCPYCSTEFTRHHNLKSHLLTHSKEKPFLCSTCNARFRRLHDLKRHTKLHTGERAHACPKCGRRFARGDALARHGKGPGGCAGRRGSMGADDEYGEGGNDDEEGMDGIIYGQRDDQESDNSLRERLEDGRSMDSRRRRSEPHGRSMNSQDEDTAQASHRTAHQSSTYPGSAVTMAAPRTSYSMAAGLASPQETQRLLSPRGAASYSSVQISAPPSTYAQGGMTESPRPLSPNHDPNRLNVDPSTRPARSSSISSLIQTTYPESRPPIGTSQYATSQSSQLPSLTSLTSESRHGAAFTPHATSAHGIHMGGASTISMAAQTSKIHTGATASNASSISSHPRSSGASTREIFGGVQEPTAASGGGARESNMWEHIQNLEGRLTAIQEDFRVQEVRYKTTISRLQEEVDMLRGQKAHDGQYLDGGSSGR